MGRPGGWLGRGGWVISMLILRGSPTLEREAYSCPWAWATYDKRGLAKYNKTVAAAQAEAALLLDQQEELDLASLQDALLLVFTNVLGTAPEHSEITEAWMDDPVVQDYLFLYERAVKQHNRRKTAESAASNHLFQRDVAGPQISFLLPVGLRTA